MELKVHVKQMLKSIACDAPYSTLADVSKDSVEKFTEESGANTRGTVYVI